MADKITQLGNALSTDSALRDEFKHDPVGVIERETGLTLSNEEKRRLGSRDWVSLDDQQLRGHLMADGIRRWL